MDFDILKTYKLYPEEIVCIKYRIPFSGSNRIFFFFFFIMSFAEIRPQHAKNHGKTIKAKI